MARMDFHAEVLLELMDMFGDWCDGEISDSTLGTYLDSLLECDVFTTQEYYYMIDWLEVMDKASAKEEIMNSIQEWFDGKK